MERTANSAAVSPSTDEARRESQSITAAERARTPLATLLAEEGVASDKQLKDAVKDGMMTGERLGEVALREGWVDEVALARLLARQWNLPFVEEEAIQRDTAADVLLAPETARELAAAVVGFEGAFPRIAVAKPAAERFARIRSALGGDASFVVTTASALDRLLAEKQPDGGGAEQEETSAPLAELDRATERLARFRGDVEQLVESQRSAAAELIEARSRLETLQGQHERTLAERDRLERELSEQRGLLESVRSQLNEVLQAIPAA
jgi:hypothetical protein